MEKFNNFEEWCRYWGRNFNHNHDRWDKIVNEGIDAHDKSKKYLFRITFDNKKNMDAAWNDVVEYWDGYGYGKAGGYVSRIEQYNYWDVFLTCPNVPIVIRMANNHGGHVCCWNDKFLKSPPKHIPFYIPAKSESKDDIDEETKKTIKLILKIVGVIGLIIAIVLWGKWILAGIIVIAVLFFIV